MSDQQTHSEQSNSYDSRPDTRLHITQVRQLLGQIIADLAKRSQDHDLSKLTDPELAVFDEYTPKLRDSTYGSDEYKAFLEGMGDGLRHHYAVNDHHPEHFAGGIGDMSGLRNVWRKSRWQGWRKCGLTINGCRETWWGS